MCCVRRGRRRLDSFVFCRDLAVEARGQAEVAKRAGAAKRVARRPARVGGSPWTPTDSGRRGEAATQESKRPPGQPRGGMQGRKMGRGGLGEPKLAPAAAFLPLPRPDRKIDAKVSWPGGRQTGKSRPRGVADFYLSRPFG